MKTIELSSYNVEIIDTLTWGMQEEIRTSMLGGVRVQGLTDKAKQDLEFDPSVLSKAKYKTLEICVKKIITKEDGKEVPYSKEWMDNLSIEDGDELFNAVNEISNLKKK